MLNFKSSPGSNVGSDLEAKGSMLKPKKGRLNRLMRAKDSIEPKDINFSMLCEKHFPGVTFDDLPHKHRAQLIRHHLRATHFLISPSNNCMMYWDFVQGFAMLYTGVITPFEVCFIKMVEPKSALFIINRFVDFLFIIDMILQFFLKVEVKGPHGSRRTVRDPWKIRMHYLQTWFPVDLVSVFPFDLVLWKAKSVNTSIKFLRCVRLLRLIKVIRILKTSKIVSRWRDHFGITFAKQRLAKFTFVLVLSSHWMACFWGMVGLNVGADLCDDQGMERDLTSLSLSEVSWATTLFSGGKDTPDSPCDPLHVYAAALHWSVMTITSIGYGDIVPVRYEEYWVCILCMLIGGLTWAYIIGSICGILSSVGPVEGAFEANMDNLNIMLKDAQVPGEERQRYREFLREAKIYDNVQQFKEVATHFSPLPKGELLLHVTRTNLQSLPYLSQAPKGLFVHLIDKLELRFYARNENLHHLSNYIVSIERGSIARGGKILLAGDIFGVDFIVHKPGLRSYSPSMALSYTLVQMLHREDFLSVVDDYPECAKSVSLHSHRLALKRAVIICAKSHARHQRESGPEDAGKCSLSSTFENVDFDCPQEYDKKKIIAKASRLAGQSSANLGEEDSPPQEPVAGPPSMSPSRKQFTSQSSGGGTKAAAPPAASSKTELALQRLDKVQSGISSAMEAAMQEIRSMRADILRDAAGIDSPDHSTATRM